MTELREELEQQFASAENQQSNEPNNDVEEQTPATPAEVDEWLDAPKSYTKEYQEHFKDLLPNWRKYLIEREKQIEKGFADSYNKLNNFKYIDEAFNGRQDRLNKFGYKNSKDWLTNLMKLDDAFAINPQATIKALSEAYDVNLNSDEQDNGLMQRVYELQQQIQQMQTYSAEQQKEAAIKQIDAFMNATDNNGKPKHPYFNEVRQDMSTLIAKGVCSSLEDAYNKCIWANDGVRNKLIAEQQQAEIAAKADKAAKAKQAGFNPTSKETAPEKELTLREELERQFNDLA